MSGDDAAGGSPDGADRPALLVAVDRRADRDLLVEALAERYEAVTVGGRGDALPSFDGAVVDAAALDRWGDELATRRNSATGFLPVLLVTGSVPEGPPPLADPLVDEVVDPPVGRRVLHARLSNLLERRRQALRLADRKEAEVREQRALAEAALAAVPDLFFTLDRDGELARWNDRLEAVTGRDAATLSAGETLELVVPEGRPRVQATVRRVLAHGESRTVEVDLVDGDGGAVPYELGLAPRVEDGTIVGAVGVGRDLTDRRMRRQLAAQNERLEKFAAIVSHDLRNPLSVATGFLDLAREQHDSSELARVGDALDRMAALIEELLALARHGRVVDEPTPVDIAAVAESAWAETDTGPDATLEVPDDGSVLADADRLRELFGNLFRNAVEHGGPDVTVTVEPTPDGFRVDDDGPGIPPDADVFEYGYTTDVEGTGFGLAIVREIADAHGWTITAGAAPSGGARFEVTGVERL
jgi:PAS domain S-box-containing protein